MMRALAALLGICSVGVMVMAFGAALVAAGVIRAAWLLFCWPAQLLRDWSGAGRR